MDTPHYPKVDDLDELFGFSAARKRAEEPDAKVPIDDVDAQFVPHRIFLNHVDSFSGKHISSV